MAAIIRIEIQTSGGLDAVKKDVASLGDTAEKAGGGFDSMREIAVGALRQIGTMGIDLALKGFQMLGDAISDGIADAKLNAQIQAQTAAVIKSTGEAAGVSAQHVADYASSLSDAAGASLFGDDQVQQSTNLLLTFTNIKDKVLDAATAISVDMAQSLGGAPKDAAIQLGKALNDPIAGITALSRVGVSFTEQQKEQIAAMQAAGDMAGAQGIILGELSKEFGGSAAAAAAATGGWSEFNGRLGEAKEALGAALLPLLTQLAGFLITNVMPAVEDLAQAFGPFVQTTIPQLVAGFGQFMTAITPIVDFIETNLRPIVAGLATVLLTVVVPAFVTWAIAAGAAALATIAALLPILVPIAAIGAAVGLLVMAWDNDFLGIKTTLVTFWETTGRPIFDALYAWLSVTLPAGLQVLSSFWTNTLQPALNAVWSFLTTYIIPVLSALVQVHLAVLGVAIRTLTAIWTNELLPAITGIWKFIQTQLGPIFTWFTTTVLQPLFDIIMKIAFFILGTLTPWLQALGKEVSGPLTGAFQHLENIADSAVSGLHNIGSAVNDVISWLSNLASKINSIGIPDWLEGHSPPPMADWFSDIGGAVGMLNQQLPTLAMNLAAQIGPGGGSVANTTNHNRPFDYNVVNHNYGPANEPMDLALARSLAGV